MLLLFHGEMAFFLFGAAVIGLIGFGILAAGLLLRPPSRPVLPAMIYLVLAALVCFWFILSGSDLASLVAMTASSPAGALIAFLAEVSDRMLGTVLLVGVLLNSVLIYGSGVLSKLIRKIVP